MDELSELRDGAGDAAHGRVTSPTRIPGRCSYICQSKMRSNSSQGPMAVRLAISGDAPALSAVTIMLLAMGRRLTLPPGVWMRLNVSHGPTAGRLAVSGHAPAWATDTTGWSAWARRAV